VSRDRGFAAGRSKDSDVDPHRRPPALGRGATVCLTVRSRCVLPTSGSMCAHPLPIAGNTSKDTGPQAELLAVRVQPTTPAAIPAAGKLLGRV
jgi:hypothetical protein